MRRFRLSTVQTGGTGLLFPGNFSAAQELKCPLFTLEGAPDGEYVIQFLPIRSSAHLEQHAFELLLGRSSLKEGPGQAVSSRGALPRYWTGMQEEQC
jgi:hypothetical protein